MIEVASVDQHAVVGQQARPASLEGGHCGVRECLGAEGGVVGAADGAAADQREQVVEKAECACNTAPASGKAA